MDQNNNNNNFAFSQLPLSEEELAAQQRLAQQFQVQQQGQHQNQVQNQTSIAWRQPFATQHQSQQPVYHSSQQNYLHSSHQQHQQPFVDYQQHQQYQQSQFYLPQQQLNQLQYQTPVPSNTFAPSSEALKPKIRKRRTGITRRRTPTACESCRLRKIKCDLGKPTCGSCKKSAIQCNYRGTNRPHEDNFSGLAGLDKKPEPPRWSSCTWYARVEGVLDWPNFESRYHVPDINALLVESNDKGLPPIGSFTKDELIRLNNDLKANLNQYVEDYCNNIQTKNPYMNVKNLYTTVEYLESLGQQYPDLYLFDGVKLPDDMIPLPILAMIAANALLSRPLTLKNLDEFKSSLKEKEATAESAHRFYMLSLYLNIIPKTKISDFDVHIVQYHLMEANYWMYNMKPLKCWDCIFKASTTVMTILESFKSSKREVSENEHRILERVFHTCLKYESELRVELSPSIPSSGIVNYDFPSVYPSPPLDGSLSLNEELSWFFYLTEIVLRKLENRILNEFYVPEGKSEENENHGKFSTDQYDLKWNSFTAEQLISKITLFIQDFTKIEANVERHLRLILQEDQATSNDVLQPHGFVFKPVESTGSASNVTQSLTLDHDSVNVDSSETSTITSNSAETDRNFFHSSSSDTTPSEQTNVKLPEVLNFIHTRMITLKMLLFRPLYYFILNVDASIAQHPFVAQLLERSGETMDLLNVQLAAHRHFGSWFYLRNTILGCALVFGLYKKLGKRFTTKDKVKSTLNNAILIVDYWLEEAPYLESSKEVLQKLLSDLEELE